MNFGSFEQIRPTMEVSEYHLIFDLNGVLVVTSEGQTKSRPLVLKPNLKEFLFACVKKFKVYIWSLTMKRNILKHLDIIIEKKGVFLPTFRILD
jgi:TFIIF-interacting CTD phosphatase-like protein